jgi:hypothetical protein
MRARKRECRPARADRVGRTPRTTTSGLSADPQPRINTPRSTGPATNSARPQCQSSAAANRERRENRPRAPRTLSAIDCAHRTHHLELARLPATSAPLGKPCPALPGLRARHADRRLIQISFDELKHFDQVDDHLLDTITRITPTMRRPTRLPAAQRRDVMCALRRSTLRVEVAFIWCGRVHGSSPARLRAGR